MGNIPAYAGKTIINESPISYRTEHPRVCGENITMTCCNDWIAGTSPRMRGKHTRRLPGIINDRNIPAYAGKT